MCSGAVHTKVKIGLHNKCSLVFKLFCFFFFVCAFASSDYSLNRRPLLLNPSLPEFSPWLGWRSLCLEWRLISLRRRCKETASAATISFITKAKT